MKKQSTGSKKPFFAHFLEFQHRISGEQQDDIQGGAATITTTPIDDEVHTYKYPSDQEDNPGEVTLPAADTSETMKYPSDSDESGPVS